LDPLPLPDRTPPESFFAGIGERVAVVVASLGIVLVASSCTRAVRIPESDYTDVEYGVYYEVTTVDGRVLRSDRVEWDGPVLVLGETPRRHEIRIPADQIVSLAREEVNTTRTVVLVTVIGVAATAGLFVLLRSAVKFGGPYR
jgi:hypothetical protein